LRMEVVRGGRPGKAAKRRCLPLEAHRGSRRSDGRRGRSGPESQSSRTRKLERKRVAAAENRKVHRRREEGYSRVSQRLKPEDFGVRALPRANGMSPIVDRRSSVNRSSCGRRTSLQPVRDLGRPLAEALFISIALMQVFSKPGARFDNSRREFTKDLTQRRAGSL
jgi:hypothetical protein